MRFCLQFQIFKGTILEDGMLAMPRYLRVLAITDCLMCEVIAYTWKHILDPASVEDIHFK